MKIENIKINAYGTLKEKEINLEDNLNIIYGTNESGKSTLLNFIKNIFYGISKNKNGKEISDYEKYTPWNGEEFSGKIKYKLNNNKIFEIYRDFNKKNSKVFNENLEDISSEFKIDKKDGNQFFYEQTGIDEKTYLSTIMSVQQEVVLDTQSQNILVQKVANLAGTGDDKVSFQRALDRLNKRQVEEVGTNRTQDRPINVVQKRMKEIEVVLKDENLYKSNKENLERVKFEKQENLKKEKEKNNIIRKLNLFFQEIKINLEKIKIKNKIKNENKEKIEKLIQEKNKLLKNNSEKIENNYIKYENNINNKNATINRTEKDKVKNKSNKVNYLIFAIIFIILIVLNIVSFTILKNNIINFILLGAILIEIILFIIYNIKNKKINNKINEQVIEEKVEDQKIREQISNLDIQINLLEKEVQKQEKEIQEENAEINRNKIEIIEKIKNENPEIDLSNILTIDSLEEIQKELEKSNEKITNYQIELNSITYEEKNNYEKLEEIISLKEEYENLKEQLEIIEEKNKCIQATKELLEKSYEEMKQSVTPKFTQNLSSLIEKITNGKYKKVSINEDKGLIVELENGEYMPASMLSAGTIDQLYLSLRLSMLDEISQEKMPIILDESFAYFDDERLENSLLFLLEQAKEHQIILFTCTHREKEILEKLNISYNWIEI